jgi:hypothetical protein
MRILRDIAIVFLLLIFAHHAEAGTYVRDFSGDAMQRQDSRMPPSPMTRFPGLLGTSFWPFISYLPAPSMTVVNVGVHMAEAPPPIPAKPPAPARFWTARCGNFVEVEAVKLIEEESKTCTP